MMRILVLGGTSFLGRAITEEALGRGHDLTLFTRGLTGPGLFPTATRLVGDRDLGDYRALTGGSWDAVVDVTAYVPRHVAQALAAVPGHRGRWLLISTGSVYDRSHAHLGMDESAPRLSPRRDTEDTDLAYGELKVAVEDDVLAHFGDRATIVRPGLIAGPHDPTDRFTRWVRRAARGGTVAVPARPGQAMRVVDARDVARLVLSLLEDDQPGAFNAMGEPTTLDDLVHACARAAGTSVELVHVDPDAVPVGFPLVLPDPSWDVLCRSIPAAARAAGLTVTSYERTAADVLAWDRARGQPPLAQDLTVEREDELLRQQRR